MYIGRTPQIGGYHKLDPITCDGSTAYTMQLNSSNFSPESVNHMIVSVNGVIQAPTTSYTISSSTITFASALTSSDTIDFIMCLGNVLDIGTPSDGTISASKLATTSITGQTSEATANDADSILIYDDSATALRKMTRANFLSGVGGANTPYFSAFINGNVGIASGTLTKMQFNGEEYDSDNAFDSTTNYRFTVPVGSAGKYLIGAQFEIEYVDDAQRLEIKLFKNGSEDQRARNYAYSPANVRELFVQTSALMNLAEGDYVEVYGQHNQGSTRTTYGQHSRFWGFKLV